MRNLLCHVFFILLGFASYGQDASYSFEGQLSEDQQVELQRSIEALPGVASVKLRYKADSMRGEALLFLDPVREDQRAEANASPFTPVDIKGIFAGFNLSGLDYHTFKP